MQDDQKTGSGNDYQGTERARQDKTPAEPTGHPTSDRHKTENASDDSVKSGDDKAKSE